MVCEENDDDLQRGMGSQSQSQSQNAGEDTRFTELLKPIKDLTQNFEVDLQP
jgi:hypothetical protein